jgi:serine/threonine protein kinase
MSASKPRLKEGDVFGDRYRIEGVVGKGGFGAVYRAVDASNGRAVALKVLLANYASSESDSKRFKREAALVKELEHPNVVQLLDYGQTERGVPYIAFELLRGRALSQALEESGPLDLDRTLRVGIDVLRALEVAHERGIIHRDIKPQNVFLLDEAPWTKVLDFGVAKAVKGEVSLSTQLTESGQMVGTPQYMAPEQVRGSGVYPSSDLYSLGLVLAEMMTAVRVLRDEALINIYMAHISPQRLPVDPRVLESPLGPVIERATSKDVSQRYGSATAMRADLERIPTGTGFRLGSANVTRPMQAFPETSTESATSKRTAPMPAVLDDELARQVARAPRVGLGKTVVMEEVDEPDPVSSGVASLAQLRGAVASPASTPSDGRSGLEAVSSARPQAFYASGANGPPAFSQPSSQGFGTAPMGYGGDPTSNHAPPSAGSAAAPPNGPYPPGPAATAPAADPQRGLKIAVALVFVTVLGLGAVAVALLR